MTCKYLSLHSVTALIFLLSMSPIISQTVDIRFWSFDSCWEAAVGGAMWGYAMPVIAIALVSNDS